MSIQTSAPAAAASNLREPRPFARLRPCPARSPAALLGVRRLRAATEDHRLLLVRLLVGASLRLGRPLDLVARRAHPGSVVNRRRRAATLWINAVLDARTDPATLDALTRTWMPRLAGTGPDIRDAAAVGPTFVEHLRGAISALVLDQLQPNLVPEAAALQTLEQVLSAHLAAFESVVGTV